MISHLQYSTHDVVVTARCIQAWAIHTIKYASLLLTWLITSILQIRGTNSDKE